MKICYITHYGKLYGANRSLMDMLEILIHRNVLKTENIMVVVAEDSDLSGELKRMGITYCFREFENDLYDGKSLKALLATGRRINARKKQKDGLIDCIRTFNPDVIHTNSSVTMAGYYVAKKLGTPHVWHVREDSEMHYRRQHDDKRAWRKTMNDSSVIAISEYIRKKLKVQGVHESTLVYNTFSNPRTAIREQNQEGTVTRFGVVGIFHERKNQEFIAKSLLPFLEQHDATLSFYGTADEDIAGRIQALTAEYPAVRKRIFVHGHKHSPSQIFAEMDVLINLSEFEAFGRVTMEAYSHGLPVIGLNSGATPELVRDGITGFLINKNEEALRHACSTMLNKEQRRRMGREGFMFFNSFNDEEIFARKLEGIYRKAIRLDDRTS